MSAEKQELKGLLSDVQKLLKQEQELYGNTLFRSSPKDVPSSMPAMKKQEIPIVEQDLFGNSPILMKPRMNAPAVSARDYPGEPWVAADSLTRLNEMICNCTKCALGHTRTNFVFGVGNPNAGLVLVGEAPGAEEDLQGEPFVGRAGQLLNKILEAINFKREEVYICNILKCRPPNNRDPQPEEIASCEPHLWKQLELIKPKIILCLGRIAAQVLLKTNDSLNNLRGKVHDYRGIKLMVTYHPAALLRNPNWKRPAWEDVQKVRKLYDEMKNV